MNLVIDQGNTYVKLAVFKQDSLVDTKIVAHLNEEIIFDFISNYTIKQGIIAAVKENVAPEMLKKYNLLQLSPSTPLPLKINYKTPQTLGLDRIAAAVGAAQLFPNNNVLAIDMGTCITYDFIAENSTYLGGGISPGFEMRFKALANYTGKLPLVEFKKNQLQLIGDTTESSIISGVYNGMKNEIGGLIAQYSLQYSNLKVVITGGDLNRFDLATKNRIFADEFLVLRGLNEILKFND